MQCCSDRPLYAKQGSVADVVFFQAGKKSKRMNVGWERMCVSASLLTNEPKQGIEKKLINKNDANGDAGTPAEKQQCA